MASKTSNLFAQIAAQQQAAAQAAATNPVTYVPGSKQDEIRGYTVLKAYAVCHPVAPGSGSGKTNHWTLSFDVGSRRGVRFDLQPNPQQLHSNGGMKACLIVSLLEYVITNNAARYDPLSVTYARTIGWYIDYLASGGRLRYAFTAEGVGCRKWITDTLKLLEDVKEIHSEESEMARRAIAYRWPDCVADEPAAGVYFA
ncbi:hypothetical protein K458DRAFT_115815 [Lentithecium fluviatile CBS 122367]|uniref:DUF7770 domain-containing protein n=1 Tax=Lentithecium fluviatile CBS 122367 TaxID=1168545 RepID=A0A6G1INW1_9PLEO|nr:hypothetical protein K458DRAFT_115815 [Lentithecium fluviatile CBS 122367]